MQAATASSLPTGHRAEDSGLRAARRAWLWVPALMILSVQWSLTETLSLAAYLLLIPLAAFLGSRYHRKGVAIVSIGALPAVLQWWYGGISGGGHIDVYLAAVIVSALAASPRNLPASFPYRVGIRKLAPALLLLPLYLSVYGTSIGALNIQLAGTLQLLLYLFVFALGMRGAGARAVVAALDDIHCAGHGPAVFRTARRRPRCAGRAARRAAAHRPDGVAFHQLDYQLDTPAAFLAAAAYFLLGRICGSMYSDQRIDWPAGRSYALLIALCVLALGREVNAYFAAGSRGADVRAHFDVAGTNVYEARMQNTDLASLASVIVIPWGDGLSFSGAEAIAWQVTPAAVTSTRWWGTMWGQ